MQWWYPAEHGTGEYYGVYGGQQWIQVSGSCDFLHHCSSKEISCNLAHLVSIEEIVFVVCLKVGSTSIIVQYQQSTYHGMVCLAEMFQFGFISFSIYWFRISFVCVGITLYNRSTRCFWAIVVHRKALWNNYAWTWRDAIVIPFLTNAGTACRLERIFPTSSSKQLSNVKLEWWFFQRNSSLFQSGPCWSWWQWRMPKWEIRTS